MSDPSVSQLRAFNPKRNNGKNKKKLRPEQPCKVEDVRLMLSKQVIKDRIIKYFDTYSSGVNSTTTVGYLDVSAITQGIAQGQRISDTLWIASIDCRFNITTANTDIFSVMRHALFIWKQNSNSVTPGATSIFEDAATWGIVTPENFEGRGYYSVIFDRAENLVGTAGAPTPTSQILTYNKYELRGHRVDFEKASTAGTGKLYWVNFSDSVLAPHPVYTLHFRIWYYDE